MKILLKNEKDLIQPTNQVLPSHLDKIPLTVLNSISIGHSWNRICIWEESAIRVALYGHPEAIASSATASI